MGRTAPFLLRQTSLATHRPPYHLCPRRSLPLVFILRVLRMLKFHESSKSMPHCMNICHLLFGRRERDHQGSPGTRMQSLISLHPPHASVPARLLTMSLGGRRAVAFESIVPFDVSPRRHRSEPTAKFTPVHRRAPHPLVSPLSPPFPERSRSAMLHARPKRCRCGWYYRPREVPATRCKAVVGHPQSHTQSAWTLLLAARTPKRACEPGGRVPQRDACVRDVRQRGEGSTYAWGWDAFRRYRRGWRVLALS